MNNNQKERLYYSRLEGWLSIICNILLFGLKYWAGIVSGSVALIADAWHTLTDSISSIVILIGARWANKAPDKEHPFGHGRIELIASMVIAFMLILVGINFIIDGVLSLREKQSMTFSTIAIVVVVISIFIKEGLAQFALWTYRKTKSSALKADAWHHRSDAISSIVILIGILLGRYFWWIDGVLAIAVSGFILHTAYEILSESIHDILGNKADEELVERIHRITQDICGKNSTAHHFNLHNYVLHQEITFHICFPGEMTIHEAHHLVSKIEDRIKAETQMFATIHIEPNEECPDSLSPN